MRCDFHKTRADFAAHQLTSAFRLAFTCVSIAHWLGEEEPKMKKAPSRWWDKCNWGVRNAIKYTLQDAVEREKSQSNSNETWHRFVDVVVVSLSARWFSFVVDVEKAIAGRQKTLHVLPCKLNPVFNSRVGWKRRKPTSLLPRRLLDAAAAA